MQESGNEILPKWYLTMEIPVREQDILMSGFIKVLSTEYLCFQTERSVNFYLKSREDTHC